LSLRVGPGTKLFYSLASLIAIGLFWMKYIEPLCPTTNPLSPLAFENIYNFITSLWGAVIAWIFITLIIVKIELVYEMINRLTVALRKPRY